MHFLILRMSIKTLYYVPYVLASITKGNETFEESRGDPASGVSTASP